MILIAVTMCQIVYILMLGEVDLSNICFLWGLDVGNYLLVDGGMLALTVTIKLLALLTYELGNRGNSQNTIHAMDTSYGIKSLNSVVIQLMLIAVCCGMRMILAVVAASFSKYGFPPTRTQSRMFMIIIFTLELYNASGVSSNP